MSNESSDSLLVPSDDHSLIIKQWTILEDDSGVCEQSESSLLSSSEIPINDISKLDNGTKYSLLYDHLQPPSVLPYSTVIVNSMFLC